MTDRPAPQAWTRPRPSLALRAFLLVWSALWTIALPLILFYLRRRGRKDALYAERIEERFGRYSSPLPDAIWVHAVSLGEMRSAVPMVRQMLDRGDRVVTTHFTPAGRRESERVFAADIATGRMRAVWVPLELEWAWKRFFRAFTPRCGLVMEIEIWPRMVAAARSAGVPLFMCNAQYPFKSMTRDNGAPLQLRQQVMTQFAGALVKSDLQRRRFEDIGLGNIAVTGELRFDQPIPPHLVTAGIAARHWLGADTRRVITIASAIENEDDTYLQAIATLREHHARAGLPMPLIVYVPRRPERFTEVEGHIQAAGLSVIRRSALFDRALDPAAWGQAPDLPDVILGDSLGEMYFYLAMSDQVIVGGGFNPKGAHNISESLVLMKPVLTGPHTGTIEYPFVEAEAAGVARSVRDADALGQALIEGFGSDPARIQAFLDAHAGGTARTLAAIPRLIAAATP